MGSVNIGIVVCGRDMTAKVEYRITDRGRSGPIGSPDAWPMEYEVESFALYAEADELAAPLWLEQTILSSYDNEIYTAIEQNEESY